MTDGIRGLIRTECLDQLQKIYLISLVKRLGATTERLLARIERFYEGCQLFVPPFVVNGAVLFSYPNRIGLREKGADGAAGHREDHEGTSRLGS